MAHYKRLLVAVDFSDQSVRALQTARDLGKRLNASLDIAHFVPVRIIGIDMEGMEAEASYIDELHKNDLEEARIQPRKMMCPTICIRVRPLSRSTTRPGKPVSI